MNNGFHHHSISSLCQGRVNKLQQDFVEPLYYPFACGQYSMTVRGLIPHALRVCRNSAEMKYLALSVCNVTG